MRECSAIMIFLVLLITDVHAGGYAGLEMDDENSKLYFLGAQTDKPLFIGFFLADLGYEYLGGPVSAPDIVSVETMLFSPSIGYRFKGAVAVSLSIGISFTDETEKRSQQKIRKKEAGGLFQLGINYGQDQQQLELLGSYNEVTEFVWSRFRYKRFVSEAYAYERYGLGLEIVSMGNDDYENKKLAMIFEKTGNIVTALIKFGMSQSNGNDTGIYGGLELSFPFQ